MAEGIKNQIIVLEPSTPSVTELLKLVREKNAAEVVTCNTVDEAIQNLSGAMPCILITCLTDNSVVPMRVQLLKRLESVIKQGALKVYMVTGMKNRQLSDLFTQKLGVTDYIIDPVPARTMFFKVNLAIKAVDNFRKIAEQKKAASEQIVIKKTEPKKTDTAAASVVTAKGKPALQMAEDTFLFKNGGVKKAGKKFVVEVEGPDPSTGEWKQHEDKGDAQSAWRWVPNEEKTTQEAGKAPQDGWVHSGDKPVFNEESGKWALASEKPQLALRKEGKVVAEKVAVDEKGEVVVAEDSPAAGLNVQKNREKAAVAIKAREEARKAMRDEASLKAQAKALQGAEAGTPDSDKKTVGRKPVLETTDQSSGRKNQAPKAKLSLADQLGGHEESNEDWQEEKGEFRNKTGGKKEQLRSAVDRRGHDIESFGQDKEAPADASTQDTPDEPKGPLEFLKQKKEQLQKTGKSQPAGDDLYAEGDLNEKFAHAEAALRPGKEPKKKDSAIDKLARLKAGLKEPEHSKDGAEVWQEEKGDFSNRTGGKKEELRSVADRRGDELESFDERKSGAEAEDAAAGETAAGEGGAGAARPRLAVKKQELAQLKARLKKPLPEEMTPEEEESARAELGLKNRPEIKVRELAKRKRAAGAARMKALLAEIAEDEREAEEEAGEVISNGKRSSADAEARAPRLHDLSEEKKKGIRSAIDGGDLSDFGDETEERRKLKKEEKKGRGQAFATDDAFYVPQAELLPAGNAWESAGGWYVYLNAETRYKGFEKLEELLPLWIFQGERVPELLGKTKQWRFFGGKPVQARALAEIPAEVRDYLLGIREQLASAAANPSSEVAAREAKGKEPRGKAGSLLDKLKAELEEELPSSGVDDTSAPEQEARAGKKTEEFDSSEAGDGKAAAKPKKDSGSAGLDALSRLRERMKVAATEKEPEEENPGQDPTEDSPTEEGSASPTAKLREKARGAKQEESALERLRRQLEDPGTDEASAETSATEEDGSGAADPDGHEKALPSKRKTSPSEESSLDELRRELEGEEEPVGAAGDKKKKDSDSGAAIRRLREQLLKAEDAAGESAEEPTDAAPAAPSEDKEEEPALAKLTEGTEKPGFGGDVNEAMRRLREKLLDKNEASEEAAGAAAADAPRESGPSKGVQSFLERRKTKRKDPEIAQQAAATAPKPAAVSVYLGLFVAVSDMLAQGKNQAGLPRVLKAFENSFGNCEAFCTGPADNAGLAEVRQTSNGSGEISIKLDSGKAEPISSPDGGGAEVMGYLFLRPQATRESFSENELETLRRVAAMLWPVLARSSSPEKNAA